VNTSGPRLAVGCQGEEQALLRTLAAELDLRGALCLGKDAHGRPTLTHQGRALSFSRSRAGSRCAVALALEGRVGVDLVAPAAWEPELLEAHFHPSERAWIAALQGEGRRDALIRGWAAKEAVLKALGLGLAFGPEAVELVIAGPDLRLVRIAGQSAEGWNLRVTSHEGHVLALAWAR